MERDDEANPFDVDNIATVNWADKTGKQQWNARLPEDLYQDCHFYLEQAEILIQHGRIPEDSPTGTSDLTVRALREYLTNHPLPPLK